MSTLNTGTVVAMRRPGDTVWTIGTALAPISSGPLAAADGPCTVQLMGGGVVNAVLDPASSAGSPSGNSAYVAIGGTWLWDTYANQFATNVTYT